jgi:hypothetical protein
VSTSPEGEAALEPVDLPLDQLEVHGDLRLGDVGQTAALALHTRGHVALEREQFGVDRGPAAYGFKVGGVRVLALEQPGLVEDGGGHRRGGVPILPALRWSHGLRAHQCKKSLLPGSHYV